MMLMTQEVISTFENLIYLPMVIQILERDRETIEISPFKLKSPYINIVEGALNVARSDLKTTNAFARNKNMKLFKKGKDDTFTEFVFIHGDYEDNRKYLNIRLRNRTEELITIYFAKYTKGAVNHG